MNKLEKALSDAIAGKAPPSPSLEHQLFKALVDALDNEKWLKLSYDEIEAITKSAFHHVWDD
jgi:hypothetical protein